MGTLVCAGAAGAATARASSRAGSGSRSRCEQAERAIAAEIRYYRAHMHEGRDAASVRALRARCAEALRAALPAASGWMESMAPR